MSDWLLHPTNAKRTSFDVITYDKSAEYALTEARDMARRFDCEVEVYILRQTHLVKRPVQLEPAVETFDANAG